MTVTALESKGQTISLSVSVWYQPKVSISSDTRIFDYSNGADDTRAETITCTQDPVGNTTNEFTGLTTLTIAT